MVNRYQLDTDDIIKIIYHYEKEYPKSELRGVYDSTDIRTIIGEYYHWSSTRYKRLLIKLVNDDIIYLQKYSRMGYGEYVNGWLNVSKLIEKFNVMPFIRNDTYIYTRLLSNSLFDDLKRFTESCDKVNLRIATNNLMKKNKSDKDDRHFTINNTGKMTYTPKGRLTAINEDRDKWLASNKFRSEIKIGKGLRKIYSNQNIVISSQSIEYLTNKLKGKYTFTGSISIVKGEKIREWYSGRNYSRENTESLGNSCMRHDSCQGYFDIYTENEDKIEMIIATNEDNKLIGRAILWKTDDHGLFCDRIYGNSMTIEAIKAYAKKLGAYVKKEQSYSNAKLVSTTGEVIDDEIIVTLNKGDFDSYPYMDTLKYTDDLENHNELILSSDSGDYELESTDGGPRNNHVTTSDGDRIHEDDASYIERTGEYVHNDDAVYSSYHSESIPYDRSISINNGDDYAWDDSDDFVFIENADTYYHRDDVVYSDYEGEYLPNDEVVSCVINGYIHQDNEKIITVADTEYCVHNDVTVEELLNEGIITEESYAEYQD